MIRLLAALDFGVGGNGLDVLRGGWSHPEEGFVWSSGHESTLELPAPASAGDVWLELTLGVLAQSRNLPRQRVLVSANAILLETRCLAAALTWRMAVPDSCLDGSESFRISLQLPDAVSPAALGIGGDRRVLAVMLKRLVLLHDSSRPGFPARRGRLRMAGDYAFGCNEDTASMLIEGWAPPEPGHVSAAGRHSILRVPLLIRNGAYTVILAVLPARGPGLPDRQRVAIGAGDRLLHYVALADHTVLALDLPEDAAGDFIDLTFDNIDARPAPDDAGDQGAPGLAFMLLRLMVFHAERRLVDEAPARLPAIGKSLQDGGLQAALLQATGQDAAAVSGQFESLGMACELGLLQRRLGAEPTSLMRFSGIFTPYLVDGLREGFPGLGRQDRMAVYVRDDSICGYHVVDGVWSLGYQTPISSLQESEDGLKRRLARVLPFLLGKYLADIVASDKIFVFQREQTSRLEVDAVVAALALWGDPTVLWTVFAPDQPAGSVVRLGPRLLCGFLDAPRTIARYASDDIWLSVMANALRLKRAQTP